VAKNILAAWVLTFPAAGLVAAVLYWVCKFVFRLP
jgi:PiT family inorganic phosphate transporter